MARWIGRLNQGSLLRRTLLHVGTFVIGALTLVGLMSLVLVSIAKAVLPPPNAERSADAAEAGEGAAGTGKSALGKTSRSRRPRSPSPAERADAPADPPMMGAH